MTINSKTKFILAFILIVLIGAGVYKFFPKRESLPFESVLVERGDIVQTVQATGQVITAKEMNLGFEIQGRIEDMVINVGEEVGPGDVLATLEGRDLEIQVLEVKANRDVALATLEQVLAGTSKEEIKVYETAVENAEISLQESKTSLKSAQQNLSDVKISSQENLEAEYEDSLNVLDSSSLKIYNAFTTVDLVQKTYFNQTGQEDIKVKENKEIIENAMKKTDSYLKIAKDSPTNENIDTALLQTKYSLEDVYGALLVIRKTCDASVLRSEVSSADKTSLDNQKSYINTALTNIVDSQQSISSTKLENMSDINTAQARVDSAKEAVSIAEGSLKSAQDKLEQMKSLPRQEDVNLARVKLEQAETSLLRAKQQLLKTKLFSPCDGVITDVKKEKGEIIATTESLLSMICKGRLQVEVDIPETDIGKVGVGNITEIILDAFPEEVFSGVVIKINPAETIIQGVVYYKVTVTLEEPGEKVKPGMTAETAITTDFRENVLIIPQRAVIVRGNKKFVKVVENGEVKELEVETGIRDENANVEVLSGLEVGDEVVTFIKENK